MYQGLRKSVGDLGPKDTTGESARDKMVFAKGFVDACRAATEQKVKISSWRRRARLRLWSRLTHRPRSSKLLLLRLRLLYPARRSTICVE